jgi:hypothetical protein
MNDEMEISKNQWRSTGGEPFWQLFNFAKLALLNPTKKFNFFLAKSILLKLYETEFSKSIHKMSQGLPNPWFRSSKVQKEDFL